MSSFRLFFKYYDTDFDYGRTSPEWKEFKFGSVSLQSLYIDMASPFMNPLVRSSKMLYCVLDFFLIFDPDYKIYLKETCEYIIVSSSVGGRVRAPRYISRKFEWHS